MPDRIRTPDDVCTVLGELFRGRGAYAATPREVEARVNWRRRFAVDDDGWAALVVRAHCAATGDSARGRYRELGLTRDRYERGWRRAAETIAVGLARERINPAALEAGEQAEDRLLSAGRIEIKGDGRTYYRRLTS